MPKYNYRSRKKQKASDDFSYQLAGIVAVGVFGAGVLYEPFSALIFNNFDDMNGILVLTVIAMIVWAMCIFLFRMLFRKASGRPKTEGAIAESFSFDETRPDQSSDEFEHEVATIINQLTGHQTEVCGGSDDGGIDVKVFNAQNRLIGIVQCKQFKPGKAVAPSYVRELNTVKHYHHVNVAYLVTTGRFTDKTMRLAKELGVRLIDGDRLNSMRRKIQ